MKEDISNPNIEWKKTGFETSERVTLKVNLKEVKSYDAAKKNVAKAPFVPAPENLPNGLKKIRKKIRTMDSKGLYEDEEEDGDDFQFAPAGLELEQGGNSLMNALNDDEKRILKQQEGLHNIKMQQTAGRMEAIAVAANLARQSGIAGVEKKAAAKNMQRVNPLEDITQLTIRDILSDKEDIRGAKVSEGKVIQTLRGVKRVKQLGGNKALQGLSLDTIQKVGEKNIGEDEVVKIVAKDDNELAKKILAKSGQDIKQKKIKDVKDGTVKVKSKGNVLTNKRNLSLKNLNDRT